MLCQRCGKNSATTHIKTIINGKVTEQSLCGYCAAKAGYTGNSFSNILASMLGHAIDGGTYTVGRSCECCGATFADIAESGKVGCANCYKFFEEEIRDVLLRQQGAMNHIGKVSTKHISKVKIKEQIEQLEEQKNEAAKEEDFMRAEILKNKIEKLKGELNG